MKRMSTEEVASDMNIPVQAVRVLAQNGKLPFVLVTKEGKAHTYYIFKELYELWKAGKL